MRKITGIILVIAMLCSLYVPVSAASGRKADFDMMVSVLSEIEIIDTSDTNEFDGNQTVTRAKFSEYVGKMININPQYTMQYFTDVPESCEQAGYINVLADCGIISFNQERIFEPDRAIRYDEAVKMLLCAMGYSDYALYKGAPMSTWVYVANETGIAITPGDFNAINLSEAVELIYNAMSKPVMVSSYNGLKMEVDDSTNIFAEYHNVYFANGTVQATNSAYLERYHLQKKGKVVINGTIFDTSLDLSDYLGLEVKYAYIYYGEDKESYVFYAKSRNPDDVMTITSEQFNNYDESSNTFYYYETENSSHTSSQSVEKNLQIIYNGAPYSDSVSNAVKGFDDNTRRGSITLADSDKNGSYDVVIVKNYEILPNGTIDTVGEKIFGGFERATIDYSNYESVKMLDTNGKEKEIYDCSDTVLNVARSDNEQIIEIVAVNDSYEIEIDSFNQEENEIMASNGSIYKLDPRVSEQNGSTFLSIKKIKVFTDIFGYVVKIELGSTGDFVVGYLINGKARPTGMDDMEVQFTVYTRSAKIEKYNFSQKVKIDGKMYDIKDKADAAMRAIPQAKYYEEGGKGKYKISPQIIRYKLNDEKQITVLDTLNLTEQEDKDNSLICRHEKLAMLNSNRFGLDTYWSTSETALFTIPVLNSDGKINKNGAWTDPVASDFSTSISLIFDHTYDVSTYNFSDDSYYVDVLVLCQQELTAVSAALVYTGTKQVWNSEDQTGETAIECISAGNEMMYKLNDGVEKQITQKGLKYGDLFYITVDGAGYGTEIKKIFDADTMKFVHSSSNDYWYYGAYNAGSNWSYRTGEDSRNQLSKVYVYKKRKDAIFGSYELSGLENGVYEEVMRIGSAPVVVIYRDIEKYEVGNLNSVLSYEEAGAGASLVLLESLTQNIKSVILYK